MNIPINNVTTNVVPLKLNQPYNLMIFLSFYSPIVLATTISFMSFIFQNFKGFIYLGYLVACCVIRSYIYQINNADVFKPNNGICSSIQYTNYGNSAFSSFVFAFTIVYLCLPMFANSDPNFWIFSGLLFYFLLDLFIKYSTKCVTKLSELVMNIFGGAMVASIVVILMYVGGSGKYLFFNEVSSNTDICYKPSNQTFKCSVFKNGELVGNV